MKVLALIPTPGYPALPHVMGSHVFEGTYDNPQGSSLRSRVLEYTPGGELLNSWTVLGQDVSKPHGVQVAANDGPCRQPLLRDDLRRRALRHQSSIGDVSELMAALGFVHVMRADEDGNAARS